MRVCSIVGARPQFVKAAVVSRKLREAGEEILVHTGQHYDEELSDVFFEELDIPEPEYHLGVESDTHGRQTAMMIAALEPVIERHSPTSCCSTAIPTRRSRGDRRLETRRHRRTRRGGTAKR